MFFQIQFVITLSHTLISLNQVPCDFPRWGQYLLGGLMVTMLVLFANFYIHAYIFKKHLPSAQKDKKYSNGIRANGDAKSNKKKA